ncbi:MAG TPA: hypothetical protein VGS16_07610 [Candidatus Dormibacteraeota bacterium]|nr:hypothetical protein [Candidatus Dormibacteraeota bacterium]
MKPTRRWRWPATVVLISFAALVIETVLHRNSPNSATTTALSLAIKATCVLCALSGLIGLFQRPKAIALVICVLGVIVGILVFMLVLSAESLSSVFV